MQKLLNGAYSFGRAAVMELTARITSPPVDAGMTEVRDSRQGEVTVPIPVREPPTLGPSIESPIPVFADGPISSRRRKKKGGLSPLMKGNVSLDMYVGADTHLPEDSEEEAGPPNTGGLQPRLQIKQNHQLSMQSRPQPLIVPPAVRPALKGKRRLLEDKGAGDMDDLLKREEDGITVQIMALVDRRSGVVERRREMAARGAMNAPQGGPSLPDPTLNFPPLIPSLTPVSASPSRINPGASYAAVTAAGPAWPAAGGQEIDGGGKGVAPKKVAKTEAKSDGWQREGREGKSRRGPPPQTQLPLPTP